MNKLPIYPSSTSNVLIADDIVDGICSRGRPTTTVTRSTPPAGEGFGWAPADEFIAYMKCIPQSTKEFYRITDDIIRSILSDGKDSDQYMYYMHYEPLICSHRFFRARKSLNQAGFEKIEEFYSVSWNTGRGVVRDAFWSKSGSSRSDRLCTVHPFVRPETQPEVLVDVDQAEYDKVVFGTG